MDPIRRAITALTGRTNVLVFTGAGISTESGIPDFRGPDGVWTRVDPAEFTYQRYVDRAETRKASWRHRAASHVLDAEPNDAHRAVVTLWEANRVVGCVTQNIDGLHQRSGSRRVIELHGSIHRNRCLDCGRRGDPPALEGAREEREVPEREPPRCGACGSYLRPDVVWFGETLPPDAVEEAWSLTRLCDVLLVVGTSGMVWPAAELPHIAARSGGRVIEVNPEPSELTPLAHTFLQGPAGVVLPELLSAVRADRGAG
jgi:NAD-dependent deacetylase